MAVTGNDRAELINTFLVGGDDAVVIAEVDAFAVSMAKKDLDVRHRAAIESGNPAADTHTLTTIAGAPEIDHFRLATDVTVFIGEDVGRGK